MSRQINVYINRTKNNASMVGGELIGIIDVYDDTPLKTIANSIHIYLKNIGKPNYARYLVRFSGQRYPQSSSILAIKSIRLQQTIDIELPIALYETENPYGTVGQLGSFINLNYPIRVDIDEIQPPRRDPFTQYPISMK